MNSVNNPAIIAIIEYIKQLYLTNSVYLFFLFVIYISIIMELDNNEIPVINCVIILHPSLHFVY